MTPKHILHTSSGDLGLALGLLFLLPFPLAFGLAFGLPPIFLFLRVLLEHFAILYNMFIIYFVFIGMGWYYLQICRVSLISKPFLYNIYIRAWGYSVMDKLNGPLSKRTYVCVAFD
jgi:hypothetical protein